jgi:hypothetical protein
VQRGSARCGTGFLTVWQYDRPHRGCQPPVIRQTSSEWKDEESAETEKTRTTIDTHATTHVHTNDPASRRTTANTHTRNEKNSH